MIPYHCPICGRFVRDALLYLVHARLPMYEVWADCSAHGEVEIKTFDFDDFQEVDYDGVTMAFRGIHDDEPIY